MIADLQQQLGIDSSFFRQFLIFFLVFVWLRYVFFSPFLALINKREGQSDGLSEEAQKLEEESARLELEHKEAISQARKQAGAEREALLAGARKEASGVVDSARAQAKSKLEQAREVSQRNFEAELAELRPEVAPMSALLVEKLMKTKVGL